MKFPLQKIYKTSRRFLVLNELTIILLLAIVISAIIYIVNESQKNVENATNEFISNLPDSSKIARYELAKLQAEVNQIRSDTSGSLFWLKLIALFVTVGGAVGGYLAAQSKATRNRLDFEHRKDVDNAYQTIVQELSMKEQPILRATAAVKLGSILQSFPSEWKVGEERKKQLIQLTKQVLAAALSIENDDKILKLITIAIVLQKSLKVEANKKIEYFADVKELDLSDAKAKNAYWARADFSEADFFRADLSKASFRSSILKGTIFKEANLIDTVFKGAIFDNYTNFEGAKVKGMNLKDADMAGVNTDVPVDASPAGDGSEIIKFSEWLRKNNFLK
ncbi:MAG TPA: pentapeptide repeat-containing protein [Panacibacter sp.]|nr:pentapeptide repeat-containing protein [Panacibacter sp.]